MKAEDLMVGNWVFDKVKQRNVIIWGISENHNFVWVNYANGVGIYTRDFDEIEFIILSEEILLKCGFGIVTESSAGKRYAYVKNGVFSSDLTFVYWVIGKTKNKFFRGDLEFKYVHELQQLYKILTKQELEIKL